VPSETKSEGRSAGAARWWIVALLIAVLIVLPAVGLYLYDLSLKRRFEAKIASLRAEGQPITFEEVLARRPKIPDEENSALILLDAFELIEELELDAEEEFAGDMAAARKLGARHSDQVQGIIRKYLDASAEPLRLIHEAALFAGGVYPLEPAENPYAIRLPHLEKLRGVARLCAREATLRAGAGDAEGAARSLVAGRRAAASLGDSGILIEMLVRYLVGAIMLDALEDSLGLCEMKQDQLRVLRQEPSCWMRLRTRWGSAK